MAWTKSFQVGLDERGVLFENGTPVRVLPPGRHSFQPWQDVDVKIYPFATALGDPPAALVSMLAGDVTTVDIAADERGVLFEREAPVRRLPPGRHVLWTWRAPRVERFNVKEPEVKMATLSPQVRALLAEDLTVIDVGEEERVVLVVDNVATRVLPPGRHGFWNSRLISAVRYDAKAITVDLPPAHAALFAGDVDVVTIGKLERGIVSKKKKPQRPLPPGTHTLWKHPDVKVDVIDVSGVGTAPLDADVRVLLTAAEYTELTVPEGAMGVRFVDGALDEVLQPGRHAAFTVEHQVTQVAIDLRERVVTVQGQDILTKDKVTLRLNTSLTYRVVDVKRLVTASKSADEVLYLSVQLALREQVARHTLDEILAERAVLDDNLKPLATAKAKDLGLELVDFGVKDVILPGDMKTLLNKVIEAQKTAEANVILRREETAAVRSMAQTAKILAENPVLLRLKELEAYQELAEKVGTLNVVMGGADNLPKIELKT